MPVSHQIWLKLAYWSLRRNHLKEKFDAGRTDNGWRTANAVPWHKLSWPSAR